MARPMRRVVTGHNAEGKSLILTDGPSPHALEVDGMPGLALINLWVSDRAPASNAGSADAAARPVVLEPPARGTIFRVVDFPPDQGMAGRLKTRETRDHRVRRTNTAVPVADQAPASCAREPVRRGSRWHRGCGAGPE